MKRNVIGIILMTLCLSIYAEDFQVLEGEWERQSFYDYMTSNPQSSTDRQKRRYQPSIAIRIESDGTGSYQEAGIVGFGINRIETQGNNEFTLYLEGYVMNEMGIGKIDIVGEVYITIIDEDSIFITNEEGFMSGGPGKLWHRVSGPAKIPVQYGVMNDTRVRLRTKPNLECDTWGFLNTGDEITIIDKSAEKQTIDDMEDYWYKVQTELFPDGWVYGAFIDFVDFVELVNSESNGQYGIINDEQVELKSKPSLDGETIEHLSIGDQVDIIAKIIEKQQIGDMEDYWYKVTIDDFANTVGWIYGSVMDIVEIVNSRNPERHGVVNDTQVEIKSTPSFAGETLDYLNIGDEVTVFGKTQEKHQVGDMEDYWYKVLREGYPIAVYWVYGAFIDFLDTEEAN